MCFSCSPLFFRSRVVDNTRAMDLGVGLNKTGTLASVHVVVVRAWSARQRGASSAPGVP